MSDTGKVVNLLQNQLYPTYQLYAQMANKKTEPKAGLRLAALITLQWLRQRLGDHVPKELSQLPEPSAYLEADDACLESFHINHGFVVDVVSLPDYGTWSLQITEPDLGSDPGNAEQRRAAVPGRIIETNVAYRITGKVLECGFKTVIADPEGTPEPAEVYRLAIIRRLLRHPDFGLRQITPLEEACTRVTTQDQVKTLLNVWRDADNQMPCVVFTQIERKKEMPSFEDVLQPTGMRSFPKIAPELQAIKKENSTLISNTRDPDYDLDRFAKSAVAYCRTYLLEAEASKRFSQMSGLQYAPGDILVLEPLIFGGGSRKIPYRDSAVRRGETIERLKEDCFTYPRGKEMTFGSIAFLSAARESLFDRMDSISRKIEGVSEELARTIQTLRAESNEELKKRDRDNEKLQEQLKHQREYQSRLESEKDDLREAHAIELEKLNAIILDRDETIAYLKRKIGQPKSHQDVPDWVKRNFSERMVFHDRAANLICDKSAQNVNLELICDALDFLATDYWERRYNQISTEEMNTRCAEKYGRPFEVSPVGSTTIEFTPQQYRIKYFRNEAGKLIESGLNYHLRVGNDPENLLRIYFLHDDEKQLIVIGSLPKHLRAVSIR